MKQHLSYLSDSGKAGLAIPRALRPAPPAWREQAGVTSQLPGQRVACADMPQFNFIQIGSHRINTFTWLMGLYADNYQQLVALFAPEGLAVGRYQSVGNDGLNLSVDVLTQHRYTVELRMTYTLCDPVTGVADPSAYIRIYRDTQQAETTHCYLGQCWQDTLGVYPAPSALVHHRLRMNTFFSKWLSYLAERGHQKTSLHPCRLSPLSQPQPWADA